MTIPHGLSAPSPTLLRFLRSQLTAQHTSTLRRCQPHYLSNQCVRAFTTARQPSSSRALSTTSSLNDSWWRRLRPRKQTKSQRWHNHNHDHDHPPLPGIVDDSNALAGGRTMKAGNELRLRCTEFDQNGNVTLVNGEFRKSELIAKVTSIPQPPPI